jgi:predicted ATPase
LISDGTYNILSILTAVYQSEKPQFLCIEEPENGLNPKVVRELVNIIRTQCEERGHYIWLNTHSQTLVSELRPEEIILVDKVNGMTQTKQVTGMDLHGLKMDEALLTNALGGGIPW